MVVAVARVALVCLPLLVAGFPVDAEPLAEVRLWAEPETQEWCHAAQALQTEVTAGCLNVGPALVEHLPEQDVQADPEQTITGQAEPDLRTQRWTVVEDATTTLPNPLDYDTFYLTRVERDGTQDCVHLVDGAPGQGPDPFQSLCVRAGTTPSWPFGNITVYPRNAALLVNHYNPTSVYRVDVTVEFTYDCSQMDDTMASMGDGSEGTYRPFYLPYRPFVNEGLGGATDPLSTPAIVEVRVEDALGEVTVSRTFLPGAGQAVGYALFSHQELDGGSELCD